MSVENYFIKYFSSLSELLREVWVYFLLGLLISAVIQEFVSTRRLLKYFGGNDWKSLARASSAGLLVSVCSCGAIPIAAKLREKGASTAAALTFLLAAPWGGFLHVLLISKFVGFGNGVLLVSASLLASFIIGTMLARMENQGIIETISRKHRKNERGLCIECMQAEEMRLKHEDEKLGKRLFYCTPINVWHIFKDIGKFILLGLLIAAALRAFLEPDLVIRYLGNGSDFLPVLIAVPFSAILEVASEGLAVLGGQLYQLGASLGVVFVITMVGVTTDMTELSMIWGNFGRKCAIAYLLTATSVAVLFGWWLNLLL